MPDLSTDQREAIAAELFALLKPFDRYAIFPGPENRIVDINLDDPRVIEAVRAWLTDAGRDAERARIRGCIEALPMGTGSADERAGRARMKADVLGVLDD